MTLRMRSVVIVIVRGMDGTIGPKGVRSPERALRISEFFLEMSALPGSEAAVFAFGPFVLDRDRRLLERDGVAVDVTPKAFDLLVYLVRRGGAAVSKDELMTALWPDTSVEESNLAFQISTLRKALGAEGAKFIATLPGRGYQFVAPLQRLEAAEAIVEQEERTTITVSETRRVWPWLIALAIVVVGAVVLLQRQRTAVPEIQSLAVLPFKPLVAAQRDEALELGMADTLITRLSRIPEVTVRPVSAVRRYSKLDDDPLAAGKELGVDAVVDGSIQRRGPRMRVTVRLLRTSDGKPVWAGQFDESADDLFDVQDVVAERVARAISERSATQAAPKLTDDLQAYELYLKGRYLMGADPVRAEEHFRRALERDPHFAAAWAGIAEAWLFRGRFGNAPPAEIFEKAREAAMKAVALDPELADAHAALAQVYGDHDWNWEDAEREYRRALELNPNSDVAHAQFAQLQLFRRRFGEALEHSARAVEIDPLSPYLAVGRGVVLENSGRTQEAVTHWEQVLRAHPNLIPALLHLGLTYVDAGKPEDAIATFDRALGTRVGSSSQLAALKAYALATAGRREEALAIVREIEKLNAPPSPNLALAWTALGDHDRAFHWLERAYRDQLYLLRIVAVMPGYEPLRKDPRYVDLMKRMRL
jgi:DNA-binding winged helix-turn-helix (wHTH) protein/TolB-like protein/Flp pilus assembly protein TadD